MTENTKIHFLKNYPPLPPLPPLTLTFILKTVIALFTAYALVIKMQSMHVCLQLSLSFLFTFFTIFSLLSSVLFFFFFIFSHSFSQYLLSFSTPSYLFFFLFCQSFCLSFSLCSSRLRYILSNRLPLHLPFLIHFSFLCYSIFLFPHPLSSFYINFSFLAFLFPLCNPIPSAYSLSSFSFLSLPFSLFLILTLFNSHPF